MTFRLKNYIYKKFVSNCQYQGGRNSTGRITLRHRGAACALKRKFLSIDLKYSVIGLNYVLVQIRPSPRRTGHVGLILYQNGLFSYILISKNALIGTIWSFDYYRFLKNGDYLKLSRIPEGFSIYNVELRLGKGGQIARSAGTSVKIINRFLNQSNKILLKFRSGEEYFVNGNCGATLGVCSNPNHWLKTVDKAGNRRLLGFRSKVRGVAMNPVDHPHGGNTAGGKPCMTPKGLLTKGVKTRKKEINPKTIFKRRERRIEVLGKVKRFKSKK